MVSKSGQPINYAPPTNKPHIGHDAPSLADVAAGRKHKITSTKKPARKTQGSSSQTLAITSASHADASADVLPSSSEGNFLKSFPAITPSCF